MKIDGETKLIGFLGSTYRTSKMYAMYNAAFAALGLNYLYVPFVVDDLAKAVEGIRHLGIAAVGVTIPYKLSIIPYLDELDAEATHVGAVAVVVNRGGRLVGGTTDGQGALRALREQTEVRGKRVVLVGAGGAARAIAFSLQGAGGAVTVLNRAEEIDLAESLGRRLGCPWGDLGRLEAQVLASDIVINTTPVGMADSPLAGRSVVPREWLRSDLTVMDIVTSPRETPLLRDAVAAGCTVVYGEAMLLWQAVAKFKLYTGIEPPVAVMREALERLQG